MSYRLALSLEQLREEVDAFRPKRDRRSDGWIGDTRHASRSSDHNPWVTDHRGVGVVRALDVDEDAGDLGRQLAEHVRELGRRGDARLRNGGYVIYEGRIASERAGWAWRAFDGNPHSHHVHVSVSEDRSPGYDSTASWGFGARRAPAPTRPVVVRPAAPRPVEARPTLRRGSRGEHVAWVQRFLGVRGDQVGGFGDDTHREVVRYQRDRDLVADGVVGPATWRRLLA